MTFLGSRLKREPCQQSPGLLQINRFNAIVMAEVRPVLMPRGRWQHRPNSSENGHDFVVFRARSDRVGKSYRVLGHIEPVTPSAVLPSGPRQTFRTVRVHDTPRTIRCEIEHQQYARQVRKRLVVGKGPLKRKAFELDFGCDKRILHTNSWVRDGFDQLIKSFN